MQRRDTEKSLSEGIEKILAEEGKALKKSDSRIFELHMGKVLIRLLDVRDFAEEEFGEMYGLCGEERKKKADKIKVRRKWKQSVGGGYLEYLSAQQTQEESLYTNLSHSGNYVAHACGRKKLGVDLEVIRTAKPEIAVRFFTKEESRAVQEADGDGKDEVFFRLWTGKEAVVKAEGSGLKIPLNSFSVLTENPVLGEKKFRLTQKKVSCGGENIWLSVAEML